MNGDGKQIILELRASPVLPPYVTRATKNHTSKCMYFGVYLRIRDIFVDVQFFSTGENRQNRKIVSRETINTRQNINHTWCMA